MASLRESFASMNELFSEQQAEQAPLSAEEAANTLAEFADPDFAIESTPEPELPELPLEPPVLPELPELPDDPVLPLPVPAVPAGCWVVPLL